MSSGTTRTAAKVLTTPRHDTPDKTRQHDATRQTDFVRFPAFAYATVSVCCSSTPTAAAPADDLEMLCVAIRRALADTMQAALNYAAKFHAYAFLWTQRQADVLASSMLTAREQTTHISGSGYAIMETFKKEVSQKRK